MIHNAFRLVVMPGDGIGPEVMEAGTAVLEAVEKRHGIAFKRPYVSGCSRH